MSAIFMHLICRNISISSKWLQLSMPLLYIGCPGVASLIYLLSMYASFVAVPFIPLVIYSQYEIDNSPKIKWAFLSSFALTMVWLSHAPTAFILTIFCIFSSIFSLIKNTKKIKALFIFWFIFGLSLSWQFITMAYFKVPSLGLNTNDNWYPSVINDLTSLYPDVFLPIGMGRVNYSVFQLGYCLWFLYLINLIYLLVNRKTNWANFATVSTSIFLLYLYPIRGFTDWLWDFTPAIVAQMNPVWPNFRFYSIISVLILISSILNLKNLNVNKFYIKNIFNIIFIFLFIWSLFQFYKTIENTTSYKFNSNYIDKIWGKKTFLHFTYGTNFDTRFGFKAHDPNLSFRMLDLNFNPIPKLDNFNYVLDKCRNDSKSIEFTQDIKILNETLVKSGTHLITKQKIQSNTNYLFCMQIVGPIENDFSIWAAPINELPNAADNINRSKSTDTQFISLPIYLPNSGDQEIIIAMRNNSKINIKKINLISYSANELPIQIESFLPFKINFEPQKFNMLFESFKVFDKNYLARVNSKEVNPIYIPGRSMLIPVKSGDYSLELLYQPPSFLFYIFLLSLFTILFSIFYFLIRSCIDLIQSRLK